MTDTTKVDKPETLDVPVGFQFTAPKETTSVAPPILIFHGLPGTGKSTLAASAPNALFMFTENGQRDLKVRTIKDAPFDTYEEFLAGLDHIGRGVKNKDAAFTNVKTLVIDTLDHLEKLVLTSVASHYRAQAANDGMSDEVVKDILTFSDIPAKYNFDKWREIDGKWETLWKRILRLRQLGLTIIGLCHSETKMIDDPNAEEPYPQHNLAIDRKRAQTFWVDEADAVGFIHYPTMRDDKGKTSVVKNPRLSFKRSASFMSKTNFGLGEYKLEHTAEDFTNTVGAVIPFFQQNKGGLK